MAEISRPKTNGNQDYKETSRVCICCGKIVPSTDFMDNKDWKEQLGKDAWCKNCLKRCMSKEDVRKYMWENNRVWDDRIWNNAANRAKREAAQSDVYMKANPSLRESLLEKLTCKNISAYINTPQYYKFNDNTCGGKYMSYEEAKDDGVFDEDSADKEQEKKYSKKFNGNFTSSELEFLEEYYSELEKDFELDNVNRRDLAKKLCKASLIADKAQQDYADGKCELKVVNDALSAVDMLSKSAEFAQCKRKENETSGTSSIGELIFKCETSGHYCAKQIEFDQDMYDMLLTELRHLASAIGDDK